MEIRLYIIHHVDVCFVSKRQITLMFGKKLIIKMILTCHSPFSLSLHSTVNNYCSLCSFFCECLTLMQIKQLVHYIIYCLRVDISDNEREAFLFAVLALPALVYSCVQANETT